MAHRWGMHVRAAVAGAAVFASLRGVTPVRAVEPGPPPPGATLTLLSPAETRILEIFPAPTTTTRAPTTTTRPRPAAPATPSTVAPDSPALRALVEAAAAERRRLAGEIADVEGRLAALEASVAAMQRGLTVQEAVTASVEVRLVAARAELDRADARLAQAELSAAAASDAALAPRTPVARPATPGHSRGDAAAQARADAAASVARRLEVRRALAALEQEQSLARRSSGGALVDLDARLDEVRQAAQALAELRRQLAAAEQAAPPTLGPAGEVILAPAPSALAAATIPAGYLSLYGRAAATCPGLAWTVVAAVGSVESGHGQSTAPGVHSSENVAGAMGPMQFLAGTWAAYGIDGDGDGLRNVYDPDDAVFGAANYLCANGGGRVDSLRSALWHYNHADWYVEMVLELAARY